MRNKAKFCWDEAARLIVVLKDGRRINLGEKAVKEIVSCLLLGAVHLKAWIKKI